MAAAELEPIVDDKAASVDSTWSWNTYLSRTAVSSLSCAAFSGHHGQAVHGLDDVIRAVKALNLRRYQYEELAREELLGEGETFRVERCVVQKAVLAVKHLKTNCAANDKAFRRRLKSVILEVQIMRHGPFKAHPNFTSVHGYGWNTRGGQIIPYILVEYAPMGTLRQYLKQRYCSSLLLLRDVEILTGDVASALSALHSCGIVHGDVKLDNVLVFESWDRPAKALAKLTDFGHALIMNDKSGKSENGPMRYGGTLIYNAPEVQNQDTYPIERADLPKCDVWAFGFLVWEACIGGKEYLDYVAEQRQTTQGGGNDDTIKPAELLRLAKLSIPGANIGAAMFLRITLHKTLQEDPSKRAPSGEGIPLWTQWSAPSLNGLKADLALHLEAPTPTYEMFRVENGREIPWGHEKQIFQGLKQAHAENISNDNNIAWQIALCYHLGFGTPRSAESALHYAEIAKAESHPVAVAFSGLLDPRNKVTEDPGQAKYALRISRLLHLTPLSQEMPPLVKACFDGVSERVLSLLFDGEPPNSATTDGCTMFHWLFMLEDSTALGSVVETLRSSGVTCRLLPNAHFNSVREAHSQWPLQLCGSPLSLAIAVNSLDAVKALLSLGADPTRYVYSSGQFPSTDPRTTWTAFHMAAKYHSPEILRELLKHVKASELKTMGPPLACALSFSTTLERFAMHGTNHPQQLERTIAAIREIQPLSNPGGNGMTPLMQAIDFQDHEVVTVLLRAEPELAKTPLRSLRDSSAFTLPIHFAAQIAARRDDPGTLSIPQLINSYSHDLSPSAPPPRDDQARTPLHLAVTGTSSLVTEWILQERKGLIHVEDFFGRTPLHCCASVATLTATLGTLLEQGASIDHTDRYGMTTLHRACYRGQVELVRALLKHNPKLDLRNNPYGTPLHCAIVAGSMDVVLVLLDAGASPNARDKRGNTPVHVAARLNRHTILRILIKREADVTLRNENGRDARSIATAAGRLGNIGALSILQQGWERVATQKILDIDPKEHRRNFGFVGDNPKKENLPPDFLWTSNLDGRALVQELGENSEVGHDGATAAEDAGDEKDGSFDARESRMARYSDVCESIRLAHYSFAGQGHWLVTETMALVWVFFEDDVLWQPPLTVHAMEIITRIAYDLCHILRNASAETQVQVKEQLRAKPERPDALREQIQLLPARQATGSTSIATGTERLPVGSLGLPIPEIAVLDDDIRVLEAAAHDTRGFLEMPTELEAERKSVDFQSSIVLNTPEEAEAESKFDGNAVEDQRKEERLRESQVPQRGENEQPPAPDIEAQAAGHIANLVVETKPSSAFPGRSLADLEELILWQLRRMPRSETLSQHSGYYFRSSIFDVFPRLKRKPNQYLRWKDAREAAARSQSQAARATTGWNARNANPIWNFV